jgi:ergothioneine biosynthesis protein EgtB
MAEVTIGDRYCDVRTRTEALAAPLTDEDQTVQSMPDVSPTKWHRAHTTWFFETFVLADTKYSTPYDPAFDYLFNSYYELVGPRFERASRGMLSRPGAAEIGKYRQAVDARVRELIDDELDERHAELVVLGLHHEQQHQELLLMDVKHVLSGHPQAVAYTPRPSTSRHGSPVGSSTPPAIELPGGIVEVGADGTGFSFDNEHPRHRALIVPSTVDARLVSNGEFLAFMDDGGYERPELWLSEGWATVRAQGWHAPLYWSSEGGGWRRFTLHGTEDVALDDPVSHVSYFEADAFARWEGGRLPTEFEWELAAAGQPTDVDFSLEPPPVTDGPGFYGSVWQWTQSAYAPYPGFRVADGAVGEYNGKFMINQQVLRGGACITPERHTRSSYRNFFPAAARWPYAGFRLAHDAS